MIPPHPWRTWGEGGGTDGGRSLVAASLRLSSLGVSDEQPLALNLGGIIHRRLVAEGETPTSVNVVVVVLEGGKSRKMVEGKAC